MFASKGIEKSRAQIDAFLNHVLPVEKSTVESQTESTALASPKTKKGAAKNVSDSLQVWANGQRYQFKEAILNVYRRANSVPQPVSGSKPLSKRKGAPVGETEAPEAKRRLKTETSEEAVFRTQKKTDSTWRDADEKTLFSDEAYRKALFVACGFSVDSTSEPEISFRQLAFVDMTLNAYISSSATTTEHHVAISEAEHKLQSTFITAGWTKAAPTPPPFKGFTLTGYKLT